MLEAGAGLQSREGDAETRNGPEACSEREDRIRIDFPASTVGVMLTPIWTSITRLNNRRIMSTRRWRDQ